METDASKDGLHVGTVLSQQQDDDKVIIFYASRTLRFQYRNVNNYSLMKLELLALKLKLKFLDYFLGYRFVAYTGNNPLNYL